MDQAERLFDEIVIDEQSCPISHDHIYHQTDHFSVQPLNANASLRCSFSECNNLTFHHKPNLLRHTQFKHPDSLHPIHLKTFRNCRRTTQSNHVLKNVSTTRFKCSLCDDWFECLEIHVIQEHTVMEVVTGGFGECARTLESDVELEGNREMHQQPQHQTNNKLNDSTNAKPMKYAQQLLVYFDSNETNDSDEESLEETDLENGPNLDEQSMNETDFDGEELAQPGQQPPQYDLNQPTNEPKADSDKHSMQSGSTQDNSTITTHPFEPQVTELDIAIENNAKTFKQTTFDCNNCGKSFISNKSLSSHTEQVHPKYLKYCGVSGCQKYFKTRPSLYRHYRLKHKEVNFPCYQCRILENKKHGDLMVKHLQTCHQISFVQPASSCLNRSNPNATQSTPNKSNPISVQSNVHLNQLQETPQQQEHQDRVSSNPTQLDVKYNSTLKHTNLILNPSTTFLSKSTHQPKPQVIELNKSAKQTSVKCSKCDKYFTSRTTLGIHCYNLHPAQSPLCEVSGCGKSFETKIHLIHHYHRVHKGVNFPCAKCYYRKKLIVDHLRTYHQIDFDPPKPNFDHSSPDSTQSTSNPISVNSNVELNQPNPPTHHSSPLSDCIMPQSNPLSSQPVFSNLDQFCVNLNQHNLNSVHTKSNFTFEYSNFTLNSSTPSTHSNSSLQPDPGESTFHYFDQTNTNHDQFCITSLEPSIPILINSNSNIDQINLTQTNPNPDQFSITSLEPSIPIVINSSIDQINLNEIVQPNCLLVQSKYLNHHRQSEIGSIQIPIQSTNAMPVEQQIIVTNLDGQQNIISHQTQPLLYSKVFDQMLNPSEQQQSQRVEEQIQNSADSAQLNSLQDISDHITFNSNQNQDQSNLNLTQNSQDSQSLLIFNQSYPIQCSPVLATDVDTDINSSLAQTQISQANNSSPSTSLQSSSISPPPNVINKKRSYQTMPNQVILSSHIPGQDTRQFICTEHNCGKTFSQLMTMKRHQRIVHQGKPVYYRCTWVGCGLKFPGTYQLKKHREQAHTGVTVYTCDYPECNKTTTDKGNMTKHRQLVHEKAMFMCKYANCGQMFTYYGGLRAHRRSVHTSGGKHKCEVENCGMGFDSVTFLRRHCEQKHQITDDHLQMTFTAKTCDLFEKTL